MVKNVHIRGNKVHVILCCMLAISVEQARTKPSSENEGRQVYSPALIARPNRAVKIQVPAFGTDSLGLPESPVELSIVFEDRGIGNLAVFSRIDFRSDDPDVRLSRDTIALPTMKLTGSGEQRVYRYVFQKTPFQLIREIDGAFNFPLVANSDVPISVLGAEVRIISDFEASIAKEQTAKNLGLRRVFPSDGFRGFPQRVANERNLSVFSRDLMRPVYEWSKPQDFELKSSVVICTAPGEHESFGIGLYSRDGVEDIRITFSGFPEEMVADVKMFREVSDDRALVPSIRTSGLNHEQSTNDFVYARIPDRLEPFDTLSIPPDTAMRVWCKVVVPVGFSPGLHRGKVTVEALDESAMMNVSFLVLPIPLDPSPHLNPVYYDPYTRVFGRNQTEVFQFFKEIGLDLFFYLDESKVGVETDTTGFITDLDLSHFVAVVAKMKREGVLRERMVFESAGYFLERGVKTHYDNLYDKLSDPVFAHGYGLLVRKIMMICRELDVSVIFSITDEPWMNGKERMIRANRLAVIIRSQGGLTTATYDGNADQATYRRPDGADMDIGLDRLVDYKVWFFGSQGGGYFRGESHYGYYTTFDSALRNPIYNRFLHGFLATRTSADVVSAYALGSFSVDPFNDFDNTDPGRRGYSDFLFAYPSWDGQLLRAINAEGIKEGIKDARYIATLERLLKERPDHPVAKQARRFLESLFERIDPNYVRYRWNTDPMADYEPILKALSAGNEGDFESFTRIRRTVWSFIRRLTTESPIPSSPKGDKSRRHAVGESIEFQSVCTERAHGFL